MGRDKSGGIEEVLCSLGEVKVIKLAGFTASELNYLLLIKNILFCLNVRRRIIGALPIKQNLTVVYRCRNNSFYFDNFHRHE